MGGDEISVGFYRPVGYSEIFNFYLLLSSESDSLYRAPASGKIMKYKIIITKHKANLNILTFWLSKKGNAFYTVHECLDRTLLYIFFS